MPSPFDPLGARGYDDARPACAGQRICRMVGKALLALDSDTFVEQVAPLQVAVGVTKRCRGDALLGASLVDRHRARYQQGARSSARARHMLAMWLIGTRLWQRCDRLHLACRGGWSSIQLFDRVCDDCVLKWPGDRQRVWRAEGISFDSCEFRFLLGRKTLHNIVTPLDCLRGPSGARGF